MPFYQLNFHGDWEDIDDDPNGIGYEITVVTLARTSTEALDSVMDCVRNCHSEGPFDLIDCAEVSDDDFLDSNRCPLHTWVGS